MEAYSAEEGIIGGIFLHFESYLPVKHRLNMSDFHNLTFRKLYGIFLDCDTKREFLDNLTGLSKDEIVAMTTSGQSFLAMPVCLESCVRALQENSRCLRLRNAMLDISSSLDSELLPRLAQLVEAESGTLDNKPVKDMGQKQVERMLTDLQDKSTASRIFTGFARIDRATAGFRKGNISIVGAKPSAGKTTFALNIALKTVKMGKTVAFFSLEMGAAQLWERLSVNYGNLDYAAVNARKMSDGDWTVFTEAANYIAGMNRLYIFDNIYTIESIADRIIAIKPDLVIIDYLQFVRTGNKFNNRHLEISHIVSELKRISKLEYCPCHICVLSQFSRGTKGADAAGMFNLKESSSIEDGGDYIMLLNRPAVEDEKEPPEKTEVRLTKNKFGRTDNGILLWFDGQHQRFRDLTKDESFPEKRKEEQPW